jgi:hypothetical protein
LVEVGLSDGGRSYAGAWTVVVSGCGLWGNAAGSCGVVEWSGGVLLHSSALASALVGLRGVGGSGRHVATFRVGRGLRNALC